MIAITRRGVCAALCAAPLAQACAKTGPEVRMFKGFDSAQMAVRIAGKGRPTLLLHGFMGTGEGWFQSGLADRLIALGRQVIAPDFRAHGRSDAPDAPSAYPTDALAMDQEALLSALGIRDFDLAGYSMGALVAVRILARGARPGRAVLGGMGDARVMGVTPRDETFRDGAAHGAKAASPGARAIGETIAKSGLKGPAILGVLKSLGRTSPEGLGAITTPILVVCGDQDNDNGAAEPLAAALGAARAVRVPGTHASTYSSQAFADAVTGYLGRA